MEKKRLFIMAVNFCLILVLITLTFVLINPEQAAAQTQKRPL